MEYSTVDTGALLRKKCWTELRGRWREDASLESFKQTPKVRTRAISQLNGQLAASCLT